MNPLARAARNAVPREESHDDEYDWMQEANCRGQTEKMFPRHYKDISYISEARAICRGCNVRDECLDYALSFPVTDIQGVWCGLTSRQLAAEQKRRGIVPTKPTIAQLWAEFTKLDEGG